LSLLMVVPIINVGMLYFLAFSAWPSQRETQRDDAEVPRGNGSDDPFSQKLNKSPKKIDV